MKIRPFNLTYFLLIFIIGMMIFLISWLLKKSSFKFKRKILLGFCIFNIIFFIIYKTSLAIGNAELERKNYIFNIWLELPIHLCNISLFLVPLGLLLDKRSLYAYGFYIAPLGAFMALTFPEAAFSDTNLLIFSSLGFYFTHANIIIIGILLVSLGFFNPRFDIIPQMILIAFCLAFGAFCINFLIRHFIHVPANYFFTHDPSGISILEMFWRILPVKFLYTIFGLGILAIYSCFVTGIFYIIRCCNLKMKEKMVHE